MSYLPQALGVESGVRKGRNVYEGYQRGWGLEFGELQQRVQADPDYQRAMSYAEGRSIANLHRLMNIFLLIKFFLPKLSFGHIVEYGSYRGGSAFFMAALADRFLPGARVYALDTFEGMPITDKGVDAHSQGDFSDAVFAEIQEAKQKHGLDNLRLVQGLFADTAPAVLKEAGSLAMVHIDCDIYDAVKVSYDLSTPYMVPMGYYVFDDATVSSCIGAAEAVEELVIQRDGLFSEQIFPHFVFRKPAERDAMSRRG